MKNLFSYVLYRGLLYRRPGDADHVTNHAELWERCLLEEIACEKDNSINEVPVKTHISYITFNSDICFTIFCQSIVNVCLKSAM